MKYGFVGTGHLGARLATSLLKNGYDVCVTDLEKSNAASVLSAGARWADTPARVADDVDGLITCLPSPAASRGAVFSESGALQAMKSGSTWIEMSTIGVDEIKALSQLAAAKGVNTLEAPVTGGLHRAATGKITVLVGGEQNVFDAHLPALQIMGGEIVYMGPVGSASLIKVITNMLALTDLIAAGEALMLAKRGGLDLRKAYEAICASSGSSREFEDWAPVILNGTLNTGFTLDLGCKDLGFVMNLGRELGVPLKLAGLVDQLFLEAREKHGGDAWTPNVIKMMEDATGVELRADGFPDVVKPL